MKVLIFTTLWPNSQQPVHGLFVRERAVALAGEAAVTIIAPVPWIPPFLGKFFPRYEKYIGIEDVETDGVLTVYHPRFLTFPKVLKSLDALMMAVSTGLFLFRKNFRWDFDFIDAHWLYPDGTAALLLGKWYRTPLTVTVHGDDLRTFSKYFLRRIQLKFTLRNAAWVWVVCDDLKKWASRIVPGISHLETMLNGVDTKKFRPRDQAECRERIGLPEKCKVLISFGRIEPPKGQALLLDALGILQGDSGDFILVFVGPVDDPRYAGEIMERARSMGLEERIIWTGPLVHERLVEWICAADLFLMASENEGCPCSLLEAMACQLPVVAAPVGGIPEVIQEGAGCVFVERNGESIAKGIKELMGRIGNRDRDAGVLHENLRTWTQVATQVLNRLEKLP